MRPGGRAWTRFESSINPKPRKAKDLKNAHAVLLEYNRRGVAEYPRRDNLTGDAPGCEHAGKPLPPMREGATSTRGVTWLPGGSSSGMAQNAKSRIGVYHSRPENPRPNFKPQESLA